MSQILRSLDILIDLFTPKNMSRFRKLLNFCICLLSNTAFFYELGIWIVFCLWFGIIIVRLSRILYSDTILPCLDWETILAYCLEDNVTQLLNIHEAGAHGFQLPFPDQYSYLTNTSRSYRENVILEPSTS